MQAKLTLHVNVKLVSKPWAFFLQDGQKGIPGTLNFKYVARSCGNHNLSLHMMCRYLCFCPFVAIIDYHLCDTYFYFWD